MRRAFCMMIVGLVGVEWPLFAAEEDMNFYKEEAQVVSASLRPQSAQQTPVPVYIVTQQDIKTMGAITIPDALRNVPGVDVTEYRAGQEEVGIRGLNAGAVWTNRILVMIDSRSVLDGYYDHVEWESLPITMDAIDHIEVVEGPASAVYGTNAVAGVINIITKTPEQTDGGRVTYTGGQHNTQQGSLLYGKKDGPLGYRINGGWRSNNQFDDPHAVATEAGMFNGLINYDFSDQAGVSVFGGFNNFNTLNSLGAIGQEDVKGLLSVTRIDTHYKDTRLRAYWNGGRTDPQSTLNTTPIDYDQFDVQADQSVSLPFKNQLVFGSSYRRNEAKGPVLNEGNRVRQDLWSAFAEDKWDIAERWMLMASGRVDRHPLTPIQFSPRGSLLYTPAPEHVFRVSAGTSYRNPTILENYFDTTQSIPLGGGLNFANTILGSQTISPETLQSIEISHNGYFRRLKTNVTGFYYRYKNIINIQNPIFTGPLSANDYFGNTPDDLHGVGGTIGGEFFVTSWLSLLSNYTYQSLNSKFPDDSSWSPRHKVNVGFTTKTGGWTTNLSVNWVDKINQPSQITTDPSDPLYLQPVSAYFLANAHVGYAFSGRLSGFELGVNAFNLFDHHHYEALPPIVSAGQLFNGEEGELIGQRITGTASYKF